MSILKILKEHTTEDNAIKSGEITYITGCRGTEIRAEINRLRIEGHPICSSNKGYYYSNNVKELYRTIANLNSRVASMTEAIEGLTLALMTLREEEERLNGNKL